jgi:hypothetical protein
MSDMKKLLEVMNAPNALGVELVESDDIYTADESLIDELEEAFEQAEQLIGKLEHIVRRLPPGPRERAKAYWLAHIQSAVDSDGHGYGNMTTDIKSTLKELGRDYD